MIPVIKKVIKRVIKRVIKSVNQETMRPTVADDKRVGLAAPHPAAHKCAIVPFASVKCFFKNVFAESQHKFAKQGASAQKREQQLNFFGILLGKCFTQGRK